MPSILNRMSTADDPPIYFKTNKFTRGYQAFVDAYGIANYGEVNPSTNPGYPYPQSAAHSNDTLPP